MKIINPPNKTRIDTITVKSTYIQSMATELKKENLTYAPIFTKKKLKDKGKMVKLIPENPFDVPAGVNFYIINEKMLEGIIKEREEEWKADLIRWADKEIITGSTEFNDGVNAGMRYLKAYLNSKP